MKLYDSNLTGSLRVSGAASNESYFVGHNVGVGTNNPRYKLHVVGDSFVDGQLTIRSGVIDSGSVLYTSGSNKFGNDMADEHAFTGSFFATASEYNLMGGKVGIGTRSPGSLLHTYGGNVQVQQGYLQIKAADSTAAYLYLQADNADNSADEFRLQSSTDNFLKFETRDGGSWNQMLSLGASDKSFRHYGAMAIFYGAITGSGDITSTKANGVISGSSTSTGSFGAGYFDGNVGMGVSTTNGARLQLQGTSALNNTLHMGNYGVQSGRIVSEGSLFLNIDATDEDSSEGQAFYFGQGGFAGGEDTLMTILQTGNVGIGTTSPGVALEVVGSISG